MTATILAFPGIAQRTRRTIAGAASVLPLADARITRARDALATLKVDADNEAAWDSYLAERRAPAKRARTAVADMVRETGIGEWSRALGRRAAGLKGTYAHVSVERIAVALRHDAARRVAG